MTTWKCASCGELTPIVYSGLCEECNLAVDDELEGEEPEALDEEE